MKILIFAPHADDEVLGVGGTIAKYIDQSSQVYVCVVTTGQTSMFSKEVLNKLRNETIKSHDYLGIEKTFFLDLPAVMLNEISKSDLNYKISDVIYEIKPDIVYIPHFGDMHLDHFIVSQAVMVAVRPLSDYKIQEVYSYETLSETEWNIPHSSTSFIPNTFVDITNYIDKKIEAMKYYSTQLMQFPHPRSIEAIESLSKVRGSTISVKAAEAFCLIRKIDL